jgi:hypothetical protein
VTDQTQETNETRTVEGVLTASAQDANTIQGTCVQLNIEVDDSEVPEELINAQTNYKSAVINSVDERYSDIQVRVEQEDKWDHEEWTTNKVVLTPSSEEERQYLMNIFGFDQAPNT